MHKYWFNGLIDEIRLYRYAFTEEEVVEIAQR
ncbi:LamG domain-containing protein [Paenibacillus sp. EZ-K15]|nr:LamG domain-containing protein [Paenibacillus sp. EZ-K15]